MKKVSMLLLMGVIALFMAACGSNNDGRANTDGDSSKKETVTVKQGKPK